MAALQGNEMTDQRETKHNDGHADVIASVAVIAIIVVAVIFWLSGMR